MPSACMAMIDRDRFRLRGAVRTMQVDFAQADSRTGEWGTVKEGPTWTFDHEGRLAGHPSEDPPPVSTIDDQGVRTVVTSRAPFVPRPPGMEYGIGMDPAVTFDVLTRYDAQDHPIEVVFRDAAKNAVLHRIVLTYDGRGRIVREQVFVGDRLGGAWSVDASAEAAASPPSDELREQLAAMFRTVMPDGVFTTIDYSHDDRGRVVRRTERMGRLSESRRTCTYDDHDNVVEEHCEESRREASVDAEGHLVTQNESSDESSSRYEYRYDERGNWIEKVVLTRVAPARDFRRSSIERRTIAYAD